MRTPGGTPALVLAVACAVVTAAAFLAPASLIDARVARMTGGNVRLIDTEGTIWRARGTLLAGSTRIPIAWRADPWSLLRGALALHLVRDPASDLAAPRADIVIAGDGVNLRDVDATLPATLFSVGPRAFWSASGDVHLTATALKWAPPSSGGAVRLDWRAARLTTLNGAATLDLGDVSLLLDANGDRLGGPVSNVGGDLAVSGDIGYRPTDGVDVSLLLVPRRADGELGQALALLGVAESGGVRVRWRIPAP